MCQSAPLGYALAGFANGTVTPSSCKWHETQCPGNTSRRVGTSLRQRVNAYGQRV